MQKVRPGVGVALTEALPYALEATLHRATRQLACLALVLAALGCEEEPPPRQPPPPEPKPAGCDRPKKANDPANVAHFPEASGGFCLDPAGSDRGFGKGARSPLDGMCELFDGECEIYKRFHVERVVEAHYVDGGGSGATVDVYLSQYNTSDNAYAMFTKRVVGEGDPAHPDTPRPIAGGGAAGLGIGNAYLWRGQFLAELTYNDSRASAAQVKDKADALLPELVKAFGDKLPGSTDPPAPVQALPADDRVPLGVRFLQKDVLGVDGIGPAAFGYYQDGDKRWRVLAMAPGDEDQAEDLVKTFAKLPGAAAEKDLGDDAARFMFQAPGEPQTEWIVARKGTRLIGLGDEPRVLRDGMSAEEHRAKTLPQDDKRKRLGRLLSSSSK
jgi:hypothetical protein